MREAHPPRRGMDYGMPQRVYFDARSAPAPKGHGLRVAEEMGKERNILPCLIYAYWEQEA